MSQMKLLTVKQFAQMCGVTPRTLKYYEQLGLLKPEMIGQNGYRYYHIWQSDAVSVIKLYQDLGLSLKEIQDMNADHSIDAMENRLQQQKSIISNRIEQLRLQELFVCKSLEHIKLAKHSLDKPTVKEISRSIVYTPLNGEKLTVVNYISNGYQNGVRMDAITHEPLGTFQDITDANGAQIMSLVTNEDAEIQTLSGKVAEMYHDSYPLKSQEAIQKLIDFAKENLVFFSSIFVVQIMENVNEDGLFLYYIVEGK